MPELPEVETIRRDLEKRIVRKKIKRLEILRPSAVKGGLHEIESVLKGSSIKHIERYGKLLVFVLNKKDKFLLIHLKMTGQLVYQMKSCLVAGGHVQSEADVSNLPSKHTRAIFHLTSGDKLYFNDQRLFGWIRILANKDLSDLSYLSHPLFHLIN